MACHPDNGHVEFCRPLAVPLLDEEVFFTVVEAFITTVEMWKGIISEYRGDENLKKSKLPDMSPFNTDSGIMLGIDFSAKMSKDCFNPKVDNASARFLPSQPPLQQF